MVDPRLFSAVMESVTEPVAMPLQYFTANAGLSSGLLLRRS
jgi:hypothetical protein